MITYKSHHYPVTFSFNLPLNCNDTTERDFVITFDYSKAGFVLINEYLVHVDSPCCFNSSDMEFVRSLTLLNAIHQNVPQIKIKPNHQ